jgi:hypothetical protein
MSRLAADWAARGTGATSALADPPVLHIVATGYGRMIQSGEMTPFGCRAALAHICLHHPRIGIDRSDAAIERAMQTALRTAYSDELAAAQDIRLGIQPLLYRRAKTAAIQTEAYRLSAARLLRPDCDAIVRDEIAKRLAAAPNRAHAR